MSIIVWIVIGGLAGWVANMIMKTDGSLLKNIVTGVVGGFVMSFFGADGFTGFNVWSFVVALVGSVILIGAINLLTGKRA